MREKPTVAYLISVGDNYGQDDFDLTHSWKIIYA